MALLDMSVHVTRPRSWSAACSGLNIVAMIRPALRSSIRVISRSGARSASSQNLQAKLRERPTRGHQGIGHTRWATHGAVTEDNAHPHRSQNGEIVVIQNGIVENYLQLKHEL